MEQSGAAIERSPPGGTGVYEGRGNLSLCVLKSSFTRRYVFRVIDTKQLGLA